MSLPFILPQVHPYDWRGQTQSCTQFLHDRLEAGPNSQTIPLISWSFPTEVFTTFINQPWLTHHRLSPAELHDIALANLAQCPQSFGFIDVKLPDGNASQLAVLKGDRRTSPNRIAAADHILNRPLINSLHQTFNATQLVAAIPSPNSLYIADLVFAFQGGLIKYAQSIPDRSIQPLTSALFILEAGEIIGKLPYELPLAVA